MCPLGYYMIIRQSKDPKLLRYELVRHAREHGVKPTAKAFNTTPKTVRKWLKRWQPGSLRGLEDRSRAPKSQTSKIDPRQRKKAIELKRKLKSWGAERIKQQFDLNISVKAILKIWKEEGLMKKKRRKHKTKNDLREVKAKWNICEQTDVDTKHLNDIPEYFLPMKKYNLPRYQYTAREVVSGLQFVGYAAECTLTYSELFAEIILDHLRQCGITFNNYRIQTDNGSEFVGSWSAKEPSIFVKTIESVEGLIHDPIPPGAHTYQADVETAHRLIEDEFFEIETFKSRRMFFDKATQYIIWFNVARKNSYKGYKTPWDIVHIREPTVKPEIAILPALDLDYILKKKLENPSQRGYHLVPYPSCDPDCPWIPQNHHLS